MALPTYKASGTFTAGQASITPPYPSAGDAPAADDIAILVVTSEAQTISLTTANGFVELGDQANKTAGTAATDPGIAVAVYWKRCAGSDSDPVVADSGNNQTAQIHLFSGCITSGDPWDVYAEGNDSGANDTSGSIPGATTTVADCLVVLVAGSSFNATSSVQFSNWTNADLANLTERTDNTHTQGLGGGHGLATGEKASAGAYGATTVDYANTSYKGMMSIALKPPGGGTDATFSATTVGEATAAGGSTSFTGTATFDSTVGNAPAAGGSSTFTGGAVFDSAVGTATAEGGSTSFAGSAVFDTAVGEAVASGGSTTFDVSGDAAFTTTVGAATADGGSTSFTGGATFDTVAGEAIASGGSTTFTGTSADATFTTVVGELIASGGVTSFHAPITGSATGRIYGPRGWTPPLRGGVSGPLSRWK